MSNHLHIIWQSKGSNNIKKIQNSFIKHTSKEFKKQLDKDGNLKDYEVNVIDRKYNFWQRDSLNKIIIIPLLYFIMMEKIILRCCHTIQETKVSLHRSIGRSKTKPRPY